MKKKRTRVKKSKKLYNATCVGSHTKPRTYSYPRFGEGLNIHPRHQEHAQRRNDEMKRPQARPMERHEYQACHVKIFGTILPLIPLLILAAIFGFMPRPVRAQEKV